MFKNITVDGSKTLFYIQGNIDENTTMNDTKTIYTYFPANKTAQRTGNTYINCTLKNIGKYGNKDGTIREGEGLFINLQSTDVDFVLREE